MRIGRLCVVLWTVAGCQTPPAEETNLDQAVYRTVVMRDSNGEDVAYRSTITRRDQLAEIAQRRELIASGRLLGAALVSKDPSCAGSDMWLFDQAHLAGNEICFSGLGTADLRAYVRVPGV